MVSKSAMYKHVDDGTVVGIEKSCQTPLTIAQEFRVNVYGELLVGATMVSACTS